MVNYKNGYKFENLVTFQTASREGYVNPAIQQGLREAILSSSTNNNENKTEKIFISCAKSKYKKITNEATEDLSFYEQLTLFRNTKSIVSIHGSGMTNMFYMEPDASFQKYAIIIGTRILYVTDGWRMH